MTKTRQTCNTCCLAYAKCLIVFLCVVIIVAILGAIKGPAAVDKMIAKEISIAMDEVS